MLTEAEGRESREWGMPGQKGVGGELVEVSWAFWPALSQLGFCQWALSRAWGKWGLVEGMASPELPS